MKDKRSGVERRKGWRCGLHEGILNQLDEKTPKWVFALYVSSVLVLAGLFSGTIGIITWNLIQRQDVTRAMVVNSKEEIGVKLHDIEVRLTKLFLNQERVIRALDRMEKKDLADDLKN